MTWVYHSIHAEPAEPDHEKLALCARDADKLECLLQAVEYREQGHQNVQPWIDSSLAALKTATGKRLAEEALRTGTLEWMTRVLNGD